jgi:hypothetical protein
VQYKAADDVMRILAPMADAISLNSEATLDVSIAQLFENNKAGVPRCLQSAVRIWRYRLRHNCKGT